jgi:peptide/nickel transport system permease protein
MAIFGPMLAPVDPSAGSDVGLAPPSPEHLLGTTTLGQDVLSQLLAGARTSLAVGFLAALVGEIIAILVGVTAGYFGGVTDEVFSILTNVFLVIPILPLQIIIVSYLGAQGWVVIALVIAFTTWSHGARKLRAQTLSIRKRDYVQAARAAGEPVWRIVNFEILPNLTAIVVTNFVFHVMAGIVVQSGLAFLGLGDINDWSWGAMLHWSDRDSAYMLGAWWWFIPPGLCIALLGAGLALINLGIDEVMNPRLRTDRKARRRLRGKSNGGRTAERQLAAVPVHP